MAGRPPSSPLDPRFFVPTQTGSPEGEVKEDEFDDDDSEGSTSGVCFWWHRPTFNQHPVSLQPTDATGAEARPHPLRRATAYARTQDLSTTELVCGILGLDGLEGGERRAHYRARGSRVSVDPAEIRVQTRICGTMREALHEEWIETSRGTWSEKRGIVVWNERVCLPLRLSELELDSCLELRLLASSAGSVRTLRARLPLFTPKGLLRSGIYEVFVYAEEREDAPLFDPDFEAEETLARASVSRSQPWLERLSQRERTEKRKKRRAERSSRSRSSSCLTLAIELSDFGVPILFTNGGDVRAHLPSLPSFSPAADPETPFKWSQHLMVVEDPGHVARIPTNPVEEKYSKLSRIVHRNDVVQHQPNTSERAELDRLLHLNKFSRKLELQERDLIWKFQHALVHDPSALVVFVACVDWHVPEQAKRATELMGKWAAIDVADALHLLTGQAEFNVDAVKAFAVQALQKTTNERLTSFIPQLVQGLRYDGAGGGGTGKHHLGRFLVERAGADARFASLLYWFVHVEAERSAASSGTPVFRNLLDTLHIALATEEKRSVREMIAQQTAFVARVMGLVREANAEKGTKDYRTKRLRQLLLARPVGSSPFPFDPVEYQLTGVLAEDARIMPSTTYPAVIRCELRRTPPAAGPSPKSVALMFKAGDDLRQDQLVIQLIETMNAVYRDVGLELDLTLYRVLATSPTQGIVEFVDDALTIAKIEDSQGGIRAYLARRAEAHGGPDAVLRRFVRSSAGYAVATYVLGIGDRHLDNILVRPNGQLFHVDFGYAFGRDKRMAMPMRVTQEMIVAMGGIQSEGYESFRRHCREAYKAVRARASLLLSVVGLMADAEIADVSLNQTAQTTLRGLRERLLLDEVSDDRAEVALMKTLDESVQAMGPRAIEMMHFVAQKFT